MLGYVIALCLIILWAIPYLYRWYKAPGRYYVPIAKYRVNQIVYLSGMTCRVTECHHNSQESILSGIKPGLLDRYDQWRYSVIMIDPITYIRLDDFVPYRVMEDRLSTIDTGLFLVQHSYMTLIRSRYTPPPVLDEGVEGSSEAEDGGDESDDHVPDGYEISRRRNVELGRIRPLELRGRPPRRRWRSDLLPSEIQPPITRYQLMGDES